MLHHKKKRKFGREKNLRDALIQSLAQALFSKGKIKTTLAKAKEIRPYAEKLITRSRHATLFDRRILASRLGDRSIVKKLIENIGPKYKDRNGGYTRIIKLPPRRSDNSDMAVIELI